MRTTDRYSKARRLKRRVVITGHGYRRYWGTNYAKFLWQLRYKIRYEQLDMDDV